MESESRFCEASVNSPQRSYPLLRSARFGTAVADSSCGMCKVEGYMDLNRGECGHDTLAIHREKAIDSPRDKGPVCFPLFGCSRDAASGSEI